MSKISGDDLRAAIKKILEDKDKRKFVQTIDLQVKLRNYTNKDKRFAGTVKLPHPTKGKFNVCILADHGHSEKAKSLGINFKTADDLKSLNRDKKAVKKLATDYHAFLASASLIRRIPKLLGPGLSKAGKFPTSVAPADDIMEKIDEVQKTIKFQLKKEFNIGCAIGHVNLTEDQIFQNVNVAVNFLVSLLKKHWQNVYSVTIKSSMGKPQRIYPA